MKLRVYKENTKPKEEEDFLRLKPTLNGIQVVACRESGEEFVGGCLLLFTTRNTVTLYEGITDTLGFRIDAAGRIQIGEPL